MRSAPRNWRTGAARSPRTACRGCAAPASNVIRADRMAYGIPGLSSTRIQYYPRRLDGAVG